MSEKPRWEVPVALQPKPGELDFDLERALESVVSLQAEIPDDAFTAPILGVERAGSGVVIGENGLVLTIGYLVTEATNVWLQGSNGRLVPAHPIGIDTETGFGLVQALGALDLPALPIGNSAAANVGEPVMMAGGGGRSQAVRARIVAKQEFSGYWEYHLDEALFTAPAHPLWGGAALIGADGRLLGIGSLHVQQTRGRGESEDVNMIVPIDLLPPILNDLMTHGPRQSPGAALARRLFHGERRPHRRGRRQRGGTGRGGRPAIGRHHNVGARPCGRIPRRPLSRDLGLWSGRRRNSDRDRARQTQLVVARQIRRSRELPEEAAVELSERFGRAPINRLRFGLRRRS